MGKAVTGRTGKHPENTHGSLQLRYLLLGILCCFVSFLAALYLRNGSAATTHADSGGASEGSAAESPLSIRGIVLLMFVRYCTPLLLDRCTSVYDSHEHADLLAGGEHTAAAAVWWMAPFLSAGGYGSEAVAFAMALAQSPFVQPHKLWISQHGDGVSTTVIQVCAAGALLRTNPVPWHGGWERKPGMPCSVRVQISDLCARVCCRRWIGQYSAPCSG
jgi:hypothetical protein